MVALDPRGPPRRVRMVIFDMDGVLVPIRSSWSFIHRRLGVEDRAREAMRLFLEGRISYLDWMRMDTQLWVEATQGRLTLWDLEAMLREVPVRREAVEAARWLRRRGIIIGIISGGIDLLAKRVAREIGADFFMANQLSYDKRGRLVPGGKPLVGVKKHLAVKRAAGEYGVPLENVMFVGDSRWDAPAMRVVGYPVAYGDPPDREALEAARCAVRSLRELPPLVEHIEERGDCGPWSLRRGGTRGPGRAPRGGSSPPP